MVLLRVSIPQQPSSSSGSSRVKRASLDGPGAGPADAAATKGADSKFNIDLAFEQFEPADDSGSRAGDSAAAAVAAAAAAAAAAGDSAAAAAAAGWGKGGVPCIPPSRATPWDVALAAAPVAAGAQELAAGTQAEEQQQQQQQQQDTLQQLVQQQQDKEGLLQLEHDQQQQQRDQLVGMEDPQQQQQGAAAMEEAQATTPANAVLGINQRALQQQQQQQQQRHRRLHGLGPEQSAIAAQVMSAALSVSRGNKTLAKAVLEDKTLVQQLVAGVAQALAAELQQQKLLVAAAATAVPVVAASGVERGAELGSFYDREAAIAAAEPWPADSSAAAGKEAGSAAAAVGDVTQFFDAEAAAADDTNYFDAEAATDPAVDLPLLPEPIGSSSGSDGSVAAGTPAIATAAGTVPATTTTSSSADAAAIATGTTAAAAGKADGEAAATKATAAAAAESATAAAAAAAAAAAGTEPAVESASEGLSIALVNDVEFHHEVTLGLMAALQQHKSQLKVCVTRERGEGRGAEGNLRVVVPIAHRLMVYVAQNDIGSVSSTAAQVTTQGMGGVMGVGAWTGFTVWAVLLGQEEEEGLLRNSLLPL
jgi:hypothetical protein